MANNAFINTDLWKEDDFLDLSVDAKFVYVSLLIGERNYIDVFKLRKKMLELTTGYNAHQIDLAIDFLEKAGFIEVYSGYIGIKKSYALQLKGTYNEINSTREYEKLPDEIRFHFYPDGKAVVVTVKPKKVKTGPKPETIKEIIAKQPEVLRVPLSELVLDRIERNKAPTTRAVKGWITKLEKMYPNDPVKQVQSIDQSIERGWMGLFEVKGGNENSEFM